MKRLKTAMVILSMLISASSWATENPKPEKSITATGAPQRVIRMGDTLNITVWQHKELSAATVVDENGNIEYLFMGVIPAAGKTVSELKEFLRKGMSENYIVDPRIDISVDRKSLTVFVTGEVQKPGTYEFRPGMTVLEAVALSGGLTDYASRRVKVIRRGINGNETEKTISISKLLKATDQRSESRLQVDDIVVVNRSWW